MANEIEPPPIAVLDPPTDPETGPFQFNLRTVFILVALLGGLLAVMSHIGPLWSVVLIWSMLLVGVHMAANAWGTRHGAAHQRNAASAAADLAARPLRFAPCTRLCRSTRLGVLMILATVAGAAVGGVLGCLGLADIYFGSIDYYGLGLGTFSGAVLGGFFGFLSSTFVHVFLRAYLEACDERKLR